MIRKTLLFLSLVLVFTMLTLAACSPNDETEKDKNEEIEPIVTKNGEFPIVEEEVTLDVLIPSNSEVEDFETNAFTKWYEEKTGVNINWEVIPEEGAKEKLNLILISGDYPDVIMHMGLTPAQLRVYGEKGIFLSLNDMIDEYGIESKKMLQNMPMVKNGITTPEGEIYALPQVNECFHCSVSQKMWIYKPWLDKLGLDIPTTTEEFYNVMKAFKTEDPNGNGKADEIPLSGMKNAWHEKVSGFLMDPFIYSDMYVKGDTIAVPWNKPEWKEGLEYLNKMYSDGLIYSGSFTQGTEQFKKLGENPGEAILGAAPAATRGFFSDVDITSDDARGPDFVVVPPLEGPNGQRIALHEPTAITVPAEFVITNNAEHPDVAFRWADAMYQEEITRRSVIGRPGKGWKEAEEGQIGLNGEPATWTLIPAEEKEDNAAWIQTGPSLRTKEFRSGKAVPEGSQEAVLWNASKKYEPYISETINPVPPLFFTEEQSVEMATIEKTITDYVDEMTAKFIIGDASLEEDWEEYIATLKSMGIERYVEIYQSAYNEKYK
ncbi:extracellular solute-binding protein [Pseudalkalibacillus decolorationis]|uniref:extracellular solute-binding protein n=1 Tax=Pseudalkalibacillus decolorationis TaxID=163879 RepID=UPI002148C6B3|nr:extracellular solute-binding protein [Pseudalkalibacillus decolorationis]